MCVCVCVCVCASVRVCTRSTNLCEVRSMKVSTLYYMQPC